MQFTFSTVATIQMEWGGSRRLGELLRTHYPNLHKVCIVTDAFLYQSGLLKEALTDLERHQWEALIIDEVVADPPEHVVLKALDKAKEAHTQVVVGFGGGSSMDAAKLIAVLLDSDQAISDIYGINKIKKNRTIPLVQVPTTAGTGSEVTPISIVTTGETTKSGIVDSALYADIALLDAELTINLPPAITAATGIDAMVHAIEAYTCTKLKNPLSDMLAKRALSLLSTHILVACQEGTNRTAREAMILGSLLAGQAFANSPVAAVHALAYPIGGHFQVAHGLSNALVLTHVLKANLPYAQSHYAELAELIVPSVQGSQAEKALAFIAFLEGIIESSGIERQLRQVGIQEADLEVLAQDAMLQTRLLQNNPRELTYDEVLAIYKAAY